MVMSWDVIVQIIAWIGTIGTGVWKIARLTATINSNTEDIIALRAKIVSMEKDAQSNERQIIELLHNIDKRLSILESFVTVKNGEAN